MQLKTPLDIHENYPNNLKEVKMNLVIINMIYENVCYYGVPEVTQKDFQTLVVIFLKSDMQLFRDKHIHTCIHTHTHMLLQGGKKKLPTFNIMLKPVNPGGNQP